MAILHPLHQQSLAEKLSAFRQREFSLMARIREPYEAVLRSWREALEREFLASFVVRPQAETPPQQVWDSQVIPFIEERVLTPLEENLDAVLDDEAQTLEEEAEDAYLLGSLFGLWELSIGGVDVDEYEVDIPADVLAATAFAGVSLIDRLRTWHQTLADKIRQTLRGSVVQRLTLPETVSVMDLIGKGFEHRVIASILNDMYRIFTQGQTHVFSDFGVRRWLWITRDDPKVCLEFCRPLHLTVTTKIPIDDTHPGCRCAIVPLIASFEETPSSFHAFVAGRARG